MDSNSALISKVLRVTIASFFAANLMTLLGSVIDGFVVGNTMDRVSIAAVGFVSPAIILCAMVGTITAISFQVRSLKCLARGDTDGAGRALTETLVLGLGLSVGLMIFTLRDPGFIFRHIGEDAAYLPLCADYLRGMAIGIPAMTAMAILTRGTQIDGDHEMSISAVVLMAVLNLLGDYAGIKLLDFDLFDVALVTSLSYYAGTAVLVWYYARPDVLIKPVVKGISLGETLRVNNIGVWGGLISVLSGLTLVLRGDILNITMDFYKVGSTGLQAYNVQVQMNYIVSIFQGSAVSALFLLGGMCTAENDKVGFKKFVSRIVKYELISAAVLSLIIFVFAGGIARLYLGDKDAEAIASAAAVLRAFSVGVTFQTLALLFANYIQLFNHFITSLTVIILTNVIVPCIGASYGGAGSMVASRDITTGIFAGLSVCHIIIALMVLPLLVIMLNRGMDRKDFWWMMPESFGTAPENELRAVISTKEEVMEFSEKAWIFCKEKGEPDRISYMTSLAIEEMATNVIEHGFTKDDKEHLLSIRLVYKEDELILRFRDDCKDFDPRKKYETFFRNGEVDRMIGIRMIMAEAKDVSYTTMLDLNNLIICIAR